MSAKPIFRWTMYETNRTGFDILTESLIRTPANLGIDAFDYVVTYNGSDQTLFQYLHNIVNLSPAKVRIITQRESDMPLPVNRGRPVSMWKVCPPRININVHEIIADNDLVIVRPFPKINEFLSSSCTLLMKDPIRFYGTLDNLHGCDEIYNSGLLGLPPGYDFGKHLRDVWARLGRPSHLNYDEEQALLTFCLKQRSPLIIELEEIKELLFDGVAANNKRLDKHHHFTGNEYGFHFVEANRVSLHTQWERYKKWAFLRRSQVSFL